jgi:hypothetical protein
MAPGLRQARKMFAVSSTRNPMMKLAEIIPDPDVLIALKADELGMQMLPVLAAWPHNGKQLQLLQFLPSRTPVAPHQDFVGYAVDHRSAQIERAVHEAWAWLVAQALLVPDTRFSDGVSMLSEWIKASTALDLLKAAMSPRTAAMTIAARANDGVVRSRAERFVRDRRTENDVELPPPRFGGRADTRHWSRIGRQEISRPGSSNASTGELTVFVFCVRKSRT